MAVEHMVWIKFHPHVTAERIEQHLSNLRSLKGKVPGILGISAGVNFTDRARGFGHGLLVTLESKAALEVYAKHPDHVAVAKPLVEDAEVMAMDFERP